MPFKLEDSYRALKFLNLPPGSVPEVQASLDKIGAVSEYLVSQIQNDLLALESLEQVFGAETGTSNFALESASVLKYKQDKRVAGILLQAYVISKRLGNYLGIKPDLILQEQMLRAFGVPMGNPQLSARLLRS